MMNLDFGPYDPCPCGSGKKYKFCCAPKSKGQSHGKYPIGTVAYYGPDDKTVTKIVAGVSFREDVLPIVERWVGSTVFGDQKVADEIKAYFAKHGVKNIVITSGIIGCPHEEGIDFPNGTECPFCPFWAGKQGIVLREGTEDSWDEDYDDGEDRDGGESDDGEIDDQPGLEGSTSNEVEVYGARQPRDLEAQHARIQAILGDEELDFAKARNIWLAHLQQNLVLPCEVKGIEDFAWEEPYVFGGWGEKEYAQLKKTQPSYKDRYQLLRIDGEEISGWMMFGGQDLAARVNRISDGKEFVLGLSELKATDRKSRNYELLDDFAVWLVNRR